MVLFTDTSTGRVEQTSKVWTSNCCWVDFGGSWHWLAEGRPGVGRVSRERDSWRFGDRQRKRSWQEAQTLFSSSMLFFSLWPHHLPNHCLSPSPISHLVTQSNTSWSLHLLWSWSWFWVLVVVFVLGPLPSGLGQEWTLSIVAASSWDSILIAIPSLFWFVSLCDVFFLLLLVEGWQPVLGRGMSWQTSSQLQPAIWITCRCCCRRWQRWWWWLWWRSW